MVGRLRIWHKLTVIALALLVPFGLGVASLTREQNVAIDFARAERQGLQVVDPLLQLYLMVPSYGRWAARPRGSADLVLPRADLEVRIDTALETLEQAAAGPADELALGPEVAAFRGSWEALRREAQTPPAVKRASEVRQRLLAIRRAVLNRSNLILDPELPSYYLMHATLEVAPTQLELVSGLRAVAEGAILPRTVAEESLQARHQELREDLRQAFVARPDLRPELEPLLLAATDRGRTFSQLVMQERRPGGAYLNHASWTASAALFQLADRCSAELDLLLLERIARQQTRKAATLGSLALLLGLALLLIYILIRSITRPLAAALAMANALAAGDLSRRAVVPSGDEVGELIAAMNEMGDALRASEQLKEQQITALRQLDQLKDDFLNVVSHELQTPLSILFVSGKLLQAGKLGPLTEKQVLHLGKMLKGAGILSTLIRDLLDMSQIQAGRFSIIRRPVAPGRVVEDVVESMASLAESRGLRIVRDVAPDLPELAADDKRLAQVLYNLIDNALKVSPAGREVTVRMVCEPAWLRCEVRDHGIGIPDRDRSRVFERFVRLEAPGGASVSGTGLGLSICRAIVVAHDGTIGVDSEVGSGSTFWFRLPLATTPLPKP